MSDSFEMLVDAEVSRTDADVVAKEVVVSLQRIGLIESKPQADAALGAPGYRPGPKIATLYRPRAGESPFWTLKTCGVERRVRRQCNELALGPSFEHIECPACLTAFESLDGQLGESVATALDEWLQELEPAAVECPNCAVARPIIDWDSTPPLGFGNLAFVFWNWPPLDAPGWRVDIARLVGDASGHFIVRTYGRL